MTCVIGLRTSEGVWLGCDSATSDYATSIPVDTPKIFRVDGFLFACVGSWRLAQILHHGVLFPVHSEDVSTEHYLMTVFIDAIRTRFKELGFLRIENSEETGGFFLLAYRDKLYTVQNDFSFLAFTSGIHATGAGEHVALGAMYALDNLSPENRIRRSLEIVSSLQPGSVLAPFHVHKL